VAPIDLRRLSRRNPSRYRRNAPPLRDVVETVLERLEPSAQSIQPHRHIARKHLRAAYRNLGTFVVLDISPRRLVHWNVTEHRPPTGLFSSSGHSSLATNRTASSFTTVTSCTRPLASARRRRCISTSSQHLCELRKRTPCERLIGTACRECLDFTIPLNERHLRRILAEWARHFNRGRPHVSLGPGIPDGPSSVATRSTGQGLPRGRRVLAIPGLGGLHHEYRLEPPQLNFCGRKRGAFLSIRRSSSAPTVMFRHGCSVIRRLSSGVGACWFIERRVLETMLRDSGRA
jgi:Integrase core domain